MASKNVFQVETRTYIAGILVPTSQVQVTSAFNAPPACTISLPPYPALYGIGRRDRIPVQVFSRDTCSASNEFNLIFEGEISSFAYSSSFGSREIQINADSVIAMLRDVKVNFLSELGDFSTSVLPGQQFDKLNNVAANFVFPYSLYIQGLGNPSSDNMIRFPGELLENMIQFVTRGSDGSAEDLKRDNTPVSADRAHGTHNRSALAGYYGRHTRMLRMDDRYVMLPYFDQEDNCWSTEEQRSAGNATCFPILSGLQRAMAVEQLAKRSNNGPQTDNIYNLMDSIVSQMEYELITIAAPTFHGEIPSKKEARLAAEKAALSAEATRRSELEASNSGTTTADGAKAIFTPPTSAAYVGRANLLGPLPTFVPSLGNGVRGIASMSQFTAPIPYSGAKSALLDNVTLPSVNQIGLSGGSSVFGAVTNPGISGGNSLRAPVITPGPNSVREVVTGGLSSAGSEVRGVVTGNDTRYTADPNKTDNPVASRGITKVVPTSAITTETVPEPEAPEELKLVSLAMKPIMYEAVPPECNIIFRSSVISINTQEYVSRTPTRVRSKDVAGGLAQMCIGDSANLAMFGMLDYFPTSKEGIEKEAAEKSVTSTSLFNEELLESEKFTGPFLYDTVAPPWMSYVRQRAPLQAGSLNIEKDKEDTRAFKEAVLKHMYLLKMYGGRTMSVSCTLNPFITPGFPAVVFDNQDSGFVFIGFVFTVSHNYSKSNTGTEVQLGFVRLLEDSVNADTRLHNSLQIISENVTHDYEKMSEVYQSLLGVNAVDFAEAARMVDAPEQEDPQAAYVFNSRKLCTFDEYAYFMGLTVADSRDDNYGGKVPSVLLGDYVVNRFEDEDILRRANTPDPNGAVTNIIKITTYYKVTYEGAAPLYIFPQGAKDDAVKHQEDLIAVDILNNVSRTAIKVRTDTLADLKSGIEVDDLAATMAAIKVGKLLPPLNKLDTAAPTDSIITVTTESVQPPGIGNFVGAEHMPDGAYHLNGTAGATWIFPEGTKAANVAFYQDAVDTNSDPNKTQHYAKLLAEVKSGVEVKDITKAFDAVTLDAPLPRLDSVDLKKTYKAAAPVSTVPSSYELRGTRKILKTVADAEFENTVYVSGNQDYTGKPSVGTDLVQVDPNTMTAKTRTLDLANTAVIPNPVADAALYLM